MQSAQRGNSYQDWLLTSYMEQMSNYHTNTALSWRRLYLSRAKLKATSRTSALLSGFAMVAMVEIQVDGNNKVPDPLLIIFGVCTTLLVTVHLIALMISTCILPNIEAISNVHSVQAVNESPHDKMRHCVEMSWICSTGLGILLFMVEIALVCWVKFYSISVNAAIASTVIVIPAAILFIIFSLMFYRTLMAHKHERHEEGLKELEEMACALNDTQSHGAGGIHHV